MYQCTTLSTYIEILEKFQYQYAKLHSNTQLCDGLNVLDLSTYIDLISFLKIMDHLALKRILKRRMMARSEWGTWIDGREHFQLELGF